MLQNYLGSLQYYLSQQLLTFCILPKFREQSGRHPHHQLAINLNDAGSTITYRESEFGNLLLQGIATPPQFSATFLPYIMPNMPPNPSTYTPKFYLVNKPPGEGKRDTGKF